MYLVHEFIKAHARVSRDTDRQRIKIHQEKNEMKDDTYRRREENNRGHYYKPQLLARWYADKGCIIISLREESFDIR